MFASWKQLLRTSNTPWNKDNWKKLILEGKCFYWNALHK